jgi:hypothetical protein
MILLGLSFAGGAVACFILIAGTVPLRRCAVQFGRRFRQKDREYQQHPEFYNAQRSWDKWDRRVHGQRIDGWKVLPEQIESQRALKQMLPSRSPNGQSIGYTALFYVLSTLGIGLAYAALLILA